MQSKGGDDDRIVMISTEGYKQLVPTEDGKNLFWTTDPNAELPIKMATSGPASMAPVTICQVLKESVKKFGELPFYF